MNTFTGINHILFYDFYGNIIDFTCKSGLIRSYSLAILLYIESTFCSQSGRFANHLTVVFGRFSVQSFLQRRMPFTVSAISKTAKPFVKADNDVMLSFSRCYQWLMVTRHTLMFVIGMHY